MKNLIRMVKVPRAHMGIIDKVKPFILAGAMSCHYAAQAENKDLNAALNELEGMLNAKTVAVMEYDKDHLFASTKEGVYERFERKGYNRAAYCMQIFHLPGQVQVIDGLDGICDENIEAYTFYHNSENITYFCDSNLIPNNPCDEISKFTTIFKARNRIDLIKKEWNEHRKSCNEKKCSLVVRDKPNTMSKKKVE